MLNVHYGMALVDDGEWIYSYGAHSTGLSGKLHVARARMQNNQLTDWQYYDGKNWNASPAASVPLTGLSTAVSEQFSVFKYDNKYILVTQARVDNHRIFSAVADAPEGPFYNEKMIFSITEPLEEKRMISYNAMAHPQYTNNGRILMCYNVNALDFQRLFDDAMSYKPRFFWTHMDMILK